MIGFFDSGFGGLTILKEVSKILPFYEYVYLGDNARTPYGPHSAETIYDYTVEGIEELFNQGAQLVVLACNTSSAVALRKIQQEYLPAHHPDKKVLGIIIPTAEEMVETKNVGIFATQATVNSGIYPIEISKYNPTANVIQQTCPLLVPIIEAGEFNQLEAVVGKYVRELFAKNGNIEAVILGCTHYAIVEEIFRKYIPVKARIFSQGKIVAQKLQEYLKKHPEIESSLRKTGRRTFFTTEDSPKVQQLAEMFYGEKIDLKVIRL